jgi:hypothetical protein
MPLEFVIATAVLIVGHFSFRGFQGETPRVRTLQKWIVYWGLVVILTVAVGRPWSLVWTVSPVLGLIVHFVWCFRNGIHPLTAEPRDRYYAARGWQKR